MGSFVSELGTLIGGGPNNSRFQAQGANIVNPLQPGQVQGAIGQSQAGLANQQALMQALQNQNGIGNQSSVFNQLQGVASGQGPNPAQAMLNQATGQNVANQAALMASQRGAAANPGLIAREAAMNGAGIQQQAVGQGATMQANQSLGALGQMGGIAGQQVGNLANATGNNAQLAQAQQQAMLNAQNQINQNNVQMTGNMNNANQAMAGVNANNASKFVSGGINGIAGGIMSGLGGGAAAPSLIAGGPAAAAGGGAAAGGTLAGAGDLAPAALFAAQGGMIPESGVTKNPKHGENAKLAAVDKKDRFSNNIMHPHMKAIAEIYHPHMSHGGPIKGERYANSQKPVPGEAKVAGDSEKNDTVPALLSPKEVILPRSVTMSKNAPEAAKKFMEEVLRKQGASGSKESPEEFKTALRKAISSRRN